MNNKIRGFEFISDKNKQNKNGIHILPIRSDDRSSGYDMYLPVDLTIKPNSKVLLFSDIKAYMQPDEVLYLHIRSNHGINKDLILSNVVGVIDSSYYNNPKNEGNIGFALKNTSDETIVLNAGERVVQAVFHKYLVADQDNVLNGERNGGIGSSGK
jgi:dUTP pyrophosphatase